MMHCLLLIGFFVAQSVSVVLSRKGLRSTIPGIRSEFPQRAARGHEKKVLMWESVLKRTLVKTLTTYRQGSFRPDSLRPG